MHAAIVFPGQGSQFAGMADVWITHDAARDVLDDATDAIGRDIVAGCRDEAALTTTEFVQPALLACDVAAFRVLDALGVPFGGAAGDPRSVIEALVAADVVDLADALRIVADGINSLRDPSRAILMVTHYQRLLDHVQPSHVHVLARGRILKSGGPELARELELRGYDWLLEAAA